MGSIIPIKEDLIASGMSLFSKLNAFKIVKSIIYDQWKYELTRKVFWCDYCEHQVIQCPYCEKAGSVKSRPVIVIEGKLTCANCYKDFYYAGE